MPQRDRRLSSPDRHWLVAWRSGNALCLIDEVTLWQTQLDRNG